MSARFRRVLDARAWKLLLPGLVVAIALSCSVFPDQAELPPSGAAGAGGEPSNGGGNLGDAGHAGPNQGGNGGDAGLGGSGGEIPVSGGAAGEAGCATEERTFTVALDTWIEAAKPTIGHGNDPSLWVVGGGGEEERRALIGFDLPSLPSGATLIRAELQLHLESNVALAERELEAFLLEQAIDESHTTWSNYTNGATGQWVTPGGDFGQALGSASIPPLIQEGPVKFDVTSAVVEVLSTVTVPLPLIVREVGAPPTPPAELAFTSLQGDALEARPRLLLEYCP